MNIEVTINGEVHIFTLYREVEAFVTEKLRYWNNFERTPLCLTVTRVPTEKQVPDLGVQVGETINTEDIFGER